MVQSLLGGPTIKGVMSEMAWLPFFMPTNKGFPDVHVFWNNPPSGKKMLQSKPEGQF